MGQIEANLPVWASDKFFRDFRKIIENAKEIAVLIQSNAHQNFETFKNDNSIRAIFEKHVEGRGNILLGVGIYSYFGLQKLLTENKDVEEAIKAFDAALRLAEEENEFIAYHCCLQILVGHLFEASKVDTLFSSKLNEVLFRAAESVSTSDAPTSYKLDVLELWLSNLSSVEGFEIPDIFWCSLLQCGEDSTLETPKSFVANELRKITLLATYRAHRFYLATGFSNLLAAVERYQDHFSTEDATVIQTRIQGILELCNVPVSELPDPSKNSESFKVLDETGRYVEVTNPVHRLILFIDEVRQIVAKLGFNKQN